MAGEAPFHEPGLKEILADGISSGRLRATTDPGEGLEEAEIALVCVGTPSGRNGDINVEQLRRVCGEIALHASKRAKALIVAIRSTAFPGTCESVVTPALGGDSHSIVVAHPEFLREGSAIRDFMTPSLLVVGGADAAARRQVAALYEPLGVEPCLVDLRTAEMIKYACNTFHALKVTFANEVGAVAAELGVDGSAVMNTLCRDTILNISRAYLKPGFAFGGSCLPKDLRALVYRASRLDLRIPLIESILPSNEQQLARAVRSVLDLPAKRIGFFGLAFKENTDDLRESPVVALIEQLIGKGRDVRIFDPHLGLDTIYGSNQRFLLASIPHIGKLLDSDFEKTLGWADHLVVTQKPQPPYSEWMRACGTALLDLTGGSLGEEGVRQAQ